MHRRGLTLLEVVLSILMLAIISASVLSAISYMQSKTVMEKHRLNAVEVAHRVIAQQLDNPDLVPDESLPIQQGDSLYYYRMVPQVIMQGDEDAGSADVLEGVRRADVSASDQLRHRLHQLVVHVYASDEEGRIDQSEPLATVVRVYNLLKGDQEVVIDRIVDIVNQMDSRRRDE
ncbi:MAG: type II secretion system protein [Phycisphaerales bacterium]